MTLIDYTLIAAPSTLLGCKEVLHNYTKCCGQEAAAAGRSSPPPPGVQLSPCQSLLLTPGPGAPRGGVRGWIQLRDTPRHRLVLLTVLGPPWALAAPWGEGALWQLPGGSQVLAPAFHTAAAGTEQQRASTAIDSWPGTPLPHAFSTALEIISLKLPCANGMQGGRTRSLPYLQGSDKYEIRHLGISFKEHQLRPRNVLNETKRN